MYLLILQIFGIGLAASALSLAVDQYYLSSFSMRHASILREINTRIVELKNKAKHKKLPNEQAHFIPVLYAESIKIRKINLSCPIIFPGGSEKIGKPNLLEYTIFLTSIIYGFVILLSSAGESLTHYHVSGLLTDIRRHIETEDLFLVAWVTLFIQLAAILVHLARARFIFLYLEKREAAFMGAADEAEVLLKIAVATQKAPPP